MYAHLWRLLKPFHQDYARYIGGVVVRQSLLVAGGYGLVWALKQATHDLTTPAWVFVVGFILWDAGLLRLDISLNTHFVRRLGFPLFGHLRTAALEKVLAMPLTWHYKQDTGTLIGKVNNGVGKVCQTVESIGRELAPALIRTGLSLVPLILLSPMVAPAILAALIVFIVMTVQENRKRRSFREARARHYNRDFGLFAEAVQYIKPVVQFGQEDRVLDRYGKVQHDIASDGMSEIEIGNRYGWRRNLLLTIVKRACQGVWIWQCRGNTVDIATVMYLNMVTEELLNSFWSYSSLLDRIYDAQEPTRVLVEMLEEEPEIRDSLNASALPVTEQVGVEIRNLSFAYSRGTQVLSNFTLRVRPGTVLGIVGPSGGGKTTIHNLLSRMFDVGPGQVLVSGHEIHRWPLKQLRGIFSYVSQSDGVFMSETTLADTIRFARPEATMNEVISAAKCACIHDDIMRMPYKYDTIVGQRGLTLSKGQQQRVALAQALIALDERRKVLVLDEFTSALDSETERRILTNIKPHLNGRTVIIIAHRLSTIHDIADEIVVVNHGHIEEKGTHAELVSAGGWYAKMAEMQAITGRKRIPQVA